jgi:ferrous iron transport protein A
MTTLDRISPRSRCRVRTVNGADGIAQRLMELGLIAGSTVEVVRLAPLGDPMQVSLGGCQLSLRKSEASRIEVELCL